jgi:hypothetical protein
MALPILPARRTPPQHQNYSPQQPQYNSQSLDSRPRAHRHRGTGFHRRRR